MKLKDKTKERIFTPFEMLVNRDMLINGYNPLDPKEIKQYWEKKLR